MVGLRLWKQMKIHLVMSLTPLKSRLAIVSIHIPCVKKYWPCRLKVGWRGKFFWLIRMSPNLPEWNSSSCWAGNVVKIQVYIRIYWQMGLNAGILKWTFIQLTFSRVTLTVAKGVTAGPHYYICTMNSHSPTSKTLPHFSLLGSKYEREMDPKTKTNS